MTKYLVIRDQFTTNYTEVETDGQKGVAAIPTPIVDIVFADDYDVKYEALRFFDEDDKLVATYAKDKWVGVIKQDEVPVTEQTPAETTEVETLPVYDASNKE